MRVDIGASGRADWGELSAGEAVVKALPGERGAEIGAWERGAGLEPGEAEENTAAAPEDDHLPSPGARELAKIFRLETERVLSSDWAVQHENRFYQVQRQSQHHAPAKGRVRVCQQEDGGLENYDREQKLKWTQIAMRPMSVKRGKAKPASAVPQTVLNPKPK